MKRAMQVHLAELHCPCKGYEDVLLHELNISEVLPEITTIDCGQMAFEGRVLAAEGIRSRLRDFVGFGRSGVGVGSCYEESSGSEIVGVGEPVSDAA